jgi:general secretion pathway protein G
MFRKNRGFTLIELLVVISIIGVLSSTSLVAFQGVKQKAKDTKSYIEIKELAKALELYKLDNNSYPGAFDTYYVSSQNGVSDNCNRGNGTLWTNIFDANFMSKYIPKLPTENELCGIIYVKYSTNNSGSPPITCNKSAEDQTGYKNSDFEYFIIILTDINGVYKNLGWVTWQYAGSPTLQTNQKCLPGPRR